MAPQEDQDRLAEIAAREQKATAPPWDVWDGPAYVAGGADLCIGAGGQWMANMDHQRCQNHAHHLGCHEDGCKVPPETDICSFTDQISAQQSADAQFIAHARQDIPYLLVEVTRLREENARLKAEPSGCVIGRYCRAHGFIHGGEAEELRERLADIHDPRVDAILDDVDARDSVAWCQTKRGPERIGESTHHESSQEADSDRSRRVPAVRVGVADAR